MSVLGWTSFPSSSSFSLSSPLPVSLHIGSDGGSSHCRLLRDTGSYANSVPHMLGNEPREPWTSLCLSVCLTVSVCLSLLYLFCLCLMYMWALGIQSQVFMLAQRALNSLSQVPSCDEQNFVWKNTMPSSKACQVHQPWSDGDCSSNSHVSLQQRDRLTTLASSTGTYPAKCRWWET